MSIVSIAMTTYNGSNYILEQLQSLLFQTRKADEVIICDDCSEDATFAIAQKFITDNKLHNWHLHKNENNLGFAENFRQAMMLTSGDIVCLCDQDDIWHKDKIEVMTGILEQEPAISALVCNYCLIDSEGKRIVNNVKKFYTPHPRKENQQGLSQVEYGSVLYYNVAQGCAGAYRRSLVDAFCSVSDFGSTPHDWALNLMAYQENGLYFLNKELLFYRIHGHNAIGINDSATAASNRINRLQKYVNELEGTLSLPLAENTRDEILAILEFTRTRILWLRKKRLKIWLKGFLQHSYVVKHYFFWQYLKDLALVLLRKMPPEC